MTDSRVRRCPTHGLRPRCPGCEAERAPISSFPTLDVPKGTAEYLLNAAKDFERMGVGTPTEFVLWIAIDLREAA